MTTTRANVALWPAWTRLDAFGVRFVDGEDGGASQGDQGEQAPPNPPAPPVQQQDGQQQDDPQGGGGRTAGEHGYPENTPLTEMTVEQREAYWKHKARQHEDAWKSVRERRLTPEQVIEMQNRLNEIDREQMTEHQREVDDARRAGGEEAAARLAPLLVRASIETALVRKAPTLSDDEIRGKVEYLDLQRFLTDSGEVDTDKVSEWATANTSPANGGSGGGQGRFPDMGGGKRGPRTETAQARADAIAKRRGYR